MHHESEQFAQSESILLDLGTAEIGARYQAGINTLSTSEFQGITKSFPIRNDLTGEQISEVIETYFRNFN